MLTNGINVRIPITGYLKEYLNVTGQGTYTLDTEEDGTTFVVMTSTDGTPTTAETHKNNIVSWIVQQLYLLAYPIDPDNPDTKKAWECLSEVSLKINGDEFYP